MRAENTELTLNYKKYKQELQEVKLITRSSFW